MQFALAGRLSGNFYLGHEGTKTRRKHNDSHVDLNHSLDFLIINYFLKKPDQH